MPIRILNIRETDQFHGQLLPLEKKLETQNNCFFFVIPRSKLQREIPLSASLTTNVTYPTAFSVEEGSRSEYHFEQCLDLQKQVGRRCC